MTATTNIHKAETITSTATRFDEQNQANTAQATETGRGGGRDRPRASLRAEGR